MGACAESRRSVVRRAEEKEARRGTVVKVGTPPAWRAGGVAGTAAGTAGLRGQVAGCHRGGGVPRKERGGQTEGPLSEMGRGGRLRRGGPGPKAVRLALPTFP